MTGAGKMAVAALVAAGILAGCAADDGQAAESSTEPAPAQASSGTATTAAISATSAEEPTTVPEPTPSSAADPTSSSSTSSLVPTPVIDDLRIRDDLTERLALDQIRFVRVPGGSELAEVENVRLFLLDNPTVELDIRVHFASFGPGTTAENDLRISESNARQIFLYLANHDIDENRIQATGRGRSELVMIPANPDGLQTREEHEANNRVEFLVTAL